MVKKKGLYSKTHGKSRKERQRKKPKEVTHEQSEESNQQRQVFLDHVDYLVSGMGSRE